MPIRGPYIIPRMSIMRWHISGVEYFRRMRFKGLDRWRAIKSEAHFLSMLPPHKRRDRLRHQIKQHYDFRRRGQYVGPLCRR